MRKTLPSDSGLGDSAGSPPEPHAKTPAYFKLRLYVAGDGPHSVQAIANLGELCREHLTDRHEIELVDVMLEPQRALEDGVLLTPLLLRLLPVPIRKIAGSLSQREAVLKELELYLPDL
jgi:circadian clock protein KaiB